MMLPRQNKNAIKIMIDNDDDAEDIARKRGEAQKQYGIIEDEPPRKVVKEETGRKNSFNAGKIQPKQETKSSSANKNHIGNSLNHKSPVLNNMAPPPALLNNKGQNLNQANKRGIGMEVHETPQGLHRYNSSQYGAVGRKEEQMDIEPP